jgi:hypothetical protein
LTKIDFWAIRRIAMKRFLPILWITALCFSGAAFSRAQSVPPGPPAGQEKVQAETVQPTAPKADKKSKSGASPKAQIKEGGKEIGAGFKNLFLGIGKGFSNMGRSIKRAWTGGGGD